jgi:putative phosphoserine phosphatase/1-acylglycerol-3-phosphate O-acyltransferase
MADAAAFFDLDRTLLRGASGPVLSEALRGAGVLPDRSIPGEGLLYRFFDTVGETFVTMLLTRQLARVAKGWEREVVREAGRNAAVLLREQIQPYARVLVDQHHEAGRRVIMATTSPYDLVAPLAEDIGVDDVIATTYGERDGRYDGSIDGHFVWGPGKLAAIRDWAAAHGVDVPSSWAYSDSIYDLPLLNAVRHPVAVNADPRLMVYAAARRWPRVHLDVPAGVPKLVGVEPQQFAQAFSRPELFPYVRFDVEGVERIPKRGPLLLAANHRSYFDGLAVGFVLAKVGRPLRFLGKREVFDAPVVGQMAKAMGGIPVDRGTGSDEPLAAAEEALAGGQLVMLMPQGTIPRGPAFFDPHLVGRWGAARLAAATKVPVIPIGLWGTERVWPRSSRVPNLLNVFDPPTVRIRVGEPVELKGRSFDADTKRIMAAIGDLLPPEAHEVRPLGEISDEELRRAWPGSYHGDLRDTGELTRRPGTDRPA